MKIDISTLRHQLYIKLDSTYHLVKTVPTNCGLYQASIDISSSASVSVDTGRPSIITFVIFRQTIPEENKCR